MIVWNLEIKHRRNELMEKSLDFVKKIVADPSRSDWTDRNWDNAIEIDSSDIFKNEPLQFKRVVNCTGGSIDSCDIEVRIDRDSDFQYCASETCLSDGSVIHLQSLIYNIYSRVISGGTFYAHLDIPEKPSKISYTVGNFVVLVEHDTNFATAEKPWLAERLTVMLPIKAEIK